MEPSVASAPKIITDVVPQTKIVSREVAASVSTTAANTSSDHTSTEPAPKKQPAPKQNLKSKESVPLAAMMVASVVCIGLIILAYYAYTKTN